MKAEIIGALIALVIITICAGSFRILLGVFWKSTERKTRMLCAGIMMVSYTISLVWGIFCVTEALGLCGSGAWISGDIRNMTLTELRTFICVLIVCINLIFGIIIGLYYSATKKHALSNREKIMLKDL